LHSDSDQQQQDQFEMIARHYDRIMDHVDYDRWSLITTVLAPLLSRGFTHVDLACGTCTLVKKMRKAGWHSFGADLSFAMLEQGRKSFTTSPLAVADLRALPFRGGADYITCLFDSLNFLLDTEDMRRGIAEMGSALSDGGILYFDIVTERMVTEFFEGQTWTETNGPFSTAWSSTYCRKTKVAETSIRINTGAASVLRERVFTQAEVEAAVEDAGLTLLGAFDAESWQKPGRKTLRIDFVATKGQARDHKSQLREMVSFLRSALGG
jgi:ubiquinone/menaquinone biosynthesis C-methylase UbiE